jgi:hypothetical protein
MTPGTEPAKQLDAEVQQRLCEKVVSSAARPGAPTAGRRGQPHAIRLRAKFSSQLGHGVNQPYRPCHRRARVEPIGGRERRSLGSRLFVGTVRGRNCSVSLAQKRRDDRHQHAAGDG